MDNERQPSNIARLGVNDSLITGGVFNFHLHSQGRVGCHFEVNLVEDDADNSAAGVTAGARVSGPNRARGRLSYRW